MTGPIFPTFDPRFFRDLITRGRGARPRTQATAEEVVAALAALKAKREALGIETPSPFPPGASREERMDITRRHLAELVQAHSTTSATGF